MVQGTGDTPQPGSSAERFPSPPGLEADPSRAASNAAIAAETESTDAATDTAVGTGLAEVQSEVRAAAFEAVEEKLLQLGANANQQALIQAIRDTVLRDVDARVSQRAEELWQRGKQVLGQMQQKHKERTVKLTEEVQRCAANCAALEEENAKLKQALGGLAARFQVLGAVLSGAEGLGSFPTAPGAVSAATPAATPPVGPKSAALPSVPSTPTLLAASDEPTGSSKEDNRNAVGGAAVAPGSKLPIVPDFPSLAAAAGPPVAAAAPPTSPTPAPQLSLAEALGGTQTPQQLRTPLSLAHSLTPTRTPESTGLPSQFTSPFGARGSAAGAGIFSFTLRKADGADLGLNVSHHEVDKVLRVEGVRSGGAVEAWNRQCIGGAGADKVVIVGDNIISVNGVAYDPPRMLEECKEKQLLKLTIVRGDRPLPMPPVLPAKASPMLKPAAPTTLRADASVFVPMRSDNKQGTPAAGVENSDSSIAGPTVNGSSAGSNTPPPMSPEPPSTQPREESAADRF
mmetsp:Transcript_118914/g.296689  ORF Transcript_118914/g.296689 Transcript_118914/m.296689 type:complete len:514 (+) Transcript_118914:101-1642(+)